MSNLGIQSSRLITLKLFRTHNNNALLVLVVCVAWCWLRAGGKARVEETTLEQHDDGPVPAQYKPTLFHQEVPLISRSTSRGRFSEIRGDRPAPFWRCGSRRGSRAKQILSSAGVWGQSRAQFCEEDARASSSVVSINSLSFSQFECEPIVLLGTPHASTT